MCLNLVLKIFAVCLVTIASGCHAATGGLTDHTNAVNGIKVNECGGYIEGLVGGINYKWNNSKSIDTCIWTIQVPLKSTLEIRLVETQTTPSCSDCFFIDIFSMDKGLPELQKTINLSDAPHDEIYNISGGPLYQIVLAALNTYDNEDQISFSMSLLGVGPDQNSSDTSNTHIYKVFEQQGGPTGLIQYTKSSIQLPSEIVSVSLHPEQGKEIHVKLSIKIGNFESYNLKPCRKYDGTLHINEVGPNIGGLGDIYIRSTECRRNHTTTVTSPLPLLITYRTTLDGLTTLDEIDIEWSTID